MAGDTDLVLERILDAPIELVWKAYTSPEHIKRWWAPRPYATSEVEIDWRPGGIFRAVMTGPDGFREDFPGCVLDFVPRERIVWTSALGPGFRPNDFTDREGCEAFAFTAVITFADAGGGKTTYKVIAMHGNAADREKHDKMGFQEGWGTLPASSRKSRRTYAFRRRQHAKMRRRPPDPRRTVTNFGSDQ